MLVWCAALLDFHGMERNVFSIIVKNEKYSLCTRNWSTALTTADLGSISAVLVPVEFEGQQMKQCKIKKNTEKRRIMKNV